MEFSKLSAPTLKELFIEQLENMILSGKLTIGEKLPSERELAESMHISRSVVNAGMSEIADKGFLEIVPRSGTYVADYRKKGKLDTLVSIMKFNGGTLPDSDILSILQIRKVLTALALELAIPRITDEEVKQLFKCSAQLDKATDSVHAADLVFEFDHLLCGFSGNTLLPLIFYSFKAPNTTLFERFFRLYGFDVMRKRTDALCVAIRARDLDSAKEILSHSINETISGTTTIYR
ncbi:MAG: FadR family transcriptional regulator [Oscillospiraceae bacterium]|nr:FadR family transcriptional regulator [Oscillospiraceae bacterium]